MASELTRRTERRVLASTVLTRFTMKRRRGMHPNINYKLERAYGRLKPTSRKNCLWCPFREAWGDSRQGDTYRVKRRASGWWGQNRIQRVRTILTSLC